MRELEEGPSGPMGCNPCREGSGVLPRPVYAPAARERTHGEEGLSPGGPTHSPMQGASVPHETTFFQLPCGARSCRLEINAGALSGEEARTLLQQMQRGGALHGMPLLIVLQRVDSFSSDARGAIAPSGLGEVESWE